MSNFGRVTFPQLQKESSWNVENDIKSCSTSHSHKCCSYPKKTWKWQKQLSSNCWTNKWFEHEGTRLPISNNHTSDRTTDTFGYSKHRNKCLDWVCLGPRWTTNIGSNKRQILPLTLTCTYNSQAMQNTVQFLHRNNLWYNRRADNDTTLRSKPIRMIVNVACCLWHEFHPANVCVERYKILIEMPCHFRRTNVM